MQCPNERLLLLTLRFYINKIELSRTTTLAVRTWLESGKMFFNNPPKSSTEDKHTRKKLLECIFQLGRSKKEKKEEKIPDEC